MATFGEVFERTEKKYRIDANQRQHLMALLDPYLQLDQYGKSVVTSIYLDSPDSSLICRSLEKPLYKEKLRIRRYGELSDMDDLSEVFLEVKKKFKGVVYKRRIRVTYGAAKAFVSGTPYEQACEAFPLSDVQKACEALSARSLQISREVKQFVDFHRPLQPSMLIACDRMAFSRRPAPANIPLSTAGAGVTPQLFDDGLRITFDDRIRYRVLSDPEAVELHLLAPGESIMEIKAVGSFPLWLAQALSECDIRPTSFSKYGEAFKASQGR